MSAHMEVYNTHGVFCNAAWSPQDRLQQPTVVAGGGAHAFLALSSRLPYGHFLNRPPQLCRPDLESLP